MGRTIGSEGISRRKALSLLGLAAMFGLAAPTTVLTVSDAEAQTVGMERRHARRVYRRERRVERRVVRHERRAVRRACRAALLSDKIRPDELAVKQNRGHLRFCR